MDFSKPENILSQDEPLMLEVWEQFTLEQKVVMVKALNEYWDLPCSVATLPWIPLKVVWVSCPMSREDIYKPIGELLKGRGGYSVNSHRKCIPFPTQVEPGRKDDVD